jgi:hypothetical protein
MGSVVTASPVASVTTILFEFFLRDVLHLAILNFSKGLQITVIVVFFVFFEVIIIASLKADLSWFIEVVTFPVAVVSAVTVVITALVVLSVLFELFFSDFNVLSIKINEVGLSFKFSIFFQTAYSSHYLSLNVLAEEISDWLVITSGQAILVPFSIVEVWLACTSFSQTGFLKFLIVDFFDVKLTVEFNLLSITEELIEDSLVIISVLLGDLLL